MKNTYTLRELYNLGVIEAVSGAGSYVSAQRYMKEWIATGKLHAERTGHYYSVTQKAWNDFVEKHFKNLLSKALLK